MLSYRLRVLDAHGKTVFASENGTVPNPPSVHRFYCVGAKYTLELAAKSSARLSRLLGYFCVGLFRSENPKNTVPALLLVRKLSCLFPDLFSEGFDESSVRTDEVMFNAPLLLAAFRLCVRCLYFCDPQAELRMRRIPEKDTFAFSLAGDRKFAADSPELRFLSEYILATVISAGGNVEVTENGFIFRLFCVSTGERLVYHTHSSNDELIPFIARDEKESAEDFSRNVADLLLPGVPESPQKRNGKQ